MACSGFGQELGQGGGQLRHRHPVAAVCRVLRDRGLQKASQAAGELQPAALAHRGVKRH